MTDAPGAPDDAAGTAPQGAAPGSGPAAGSAAPAWAERLAIDVAIRLACLGLLAAWTWELVEPFALILVWSAIFAVALAPVHGALAGWLGGRSGLAAGLLTLASLAVVLGPAAVLGASLAGTLEGFAVALGEGRLSVPPPPARLLELPLVGERLHAAWGAVSGNLAEVLNANAGAILEAMRPLLGSLLGAGQAVLSFALAIVIAGFLYGRAGALGAEAAVAADRIVAHRGRELMQMAVATIRNVSQGVLGISLLQAVLAGLGLIAAGVPAPGLITFAVLVLGIVQIGSGIVVLGVLAWAFANLDGLTAALLAAWLVPVGLIDNVLKPLLLGRGLRTPMLVVLVGVIGGTLAHGLVGLFLGPVVLAVAWDLATAWVHRRAGREPDAPG